ncbi:MAG TPA: valine--tRNA ligase [Candidatus Krumholzibacteria bacterium]|nr:valine--tRNA ligase [Candidatus Krumholzibacteria bacterium]
MIEKHFDPAAARARWNRAWEAQNLFRPDDASAREPFVIILPPPNVTGVLHVGHVLGDTVQDQLIRWKKMSGFNTLWIPGTDHAGIATQKVVEAALLKEGKSRADMTREEFLAHAWTWKEHHHARIAEQMRQLGCAFDWTREAFTLDEPRSRAVREAFVRLYEKGLIYRGDYIVNWCPSCQTALSDEEVQYDERDSSLWWIRYPSAHGEVVVATTRPETMLGDTAVAVSPDDAAKRALVGKTVTLPIVGRELPIVADEVVDREFGSGFVKVTPAHDANDFAIGRRHALPSIVVIDRTGHMTPEAGAEFAGLDRFAARKQVVAQLERDGHLVKVEPYRHSVGTHDRCGTVIEPLLSRQWFVRMQPLAEPAVRVVENDEITFYPPRWRNVYMSWMTNIRDWCVSRQLWWGHRIPVWYCDDCDHFTVAREDPSVCGGCGGGRIRQDDDVLDTWFSSWLWTFSPMGWPDENAPDLKRYHPTSVLVTGSEIIFFWVARMIMASLEFMGEVPFRHVFLTGIVRDGIGRKMSKSLGNSPDPLDIIDKWGTDAFRFTLSMLSPPGKDVFFDEEKLEVGRNFTNKVWQASRLVLGAVEKEAEPLFGAAAGEESGDQPGGGFAGAWQEAFGSTLAFEPELAWEDRWILSALARCAADSNRCYEEWRLNDVASRIYDFFWHDFCDWYLELAKVRLYGEGDRRTVLAVLLHVLGESIRMLHPLMPYVSEEIWAALPMASGLLMENRFPRGNETSLDAEAEERMRLMRDIVTSVRNIRAAYHVAPAARVPVRVRAPEERAALIRNAADGIVRLAGAASLEAGPEVAKEKGDAATPMGDIEVVVPLRGVVDLEGERARLGREREKTQGELAAVVAKLSNEAFVTRAKPEVVERERERRARLETELARLQESIGLLGADT